MDAVGFRFCFTPLAGVLFTVPSRYCALSVTISILPWTVVGPASHRISRVPWYSRWVCRGTRWLVQDCHLLWSAVPGRSRPSGPVGVRDAPRTTRLTTPRPQGVHAWHGRGLGSHPGRSPLLRMEYDFLPVLRCFSSRRSLPQHTAVGRQPNVGGVAPFGHGRLNAWMPLPFPFAADQRPSSADRAEASSNRASCLAWLLDYSTSIFCYFFK